MGSAPSDNREPVEQKRSVGKAGIRKKRVSGNRLEDFGNYD